MARNYIASDYAGIDTENLSVYYGYEELTEASEWCFVARVGDRELLRIPSSKLEAQDKFDCASCLLAGIGMLFDKYGVR